MTKLHSNFIAWRDQNNSCSLTIKNLFSTTAVGDNKPVEIRADRLEIFVKFRQRYLYEHNA